LLVCFAGFGCCLPLGCLWVLAGLVPCFVLELSFVPQYAAVLQNTTVAFKLLDQEPLGSIS
jgi:hypothetical protein